MGAMTLTHNDNGDMTYDGAHQYKWDAFGRLREVWNGAGTSKVASYYSDADHRRVRKRFVSGTDLDFLYDGWRTIEIRKTATQLPYFQSLFGNYLDELIEADINGGTLDGTCTGTGDGAYFATQNALFSVYAMTRGQNSIHTAYSYDPYGGLTRIMDGNDGDITVNFNGNDTRTINATSVFFFCYTGQMFDNESGLYYYKRRYYHPALGRFISRDPEGYEDGPNLSEYADNNPGRNQDPFGTISVPVSRNEKPGVFNWLIFYTSAQRLEAYKVRSPQQQIIGSITISPVFSGNVRGSSPVPPGRHCVLDKVNTGRAPGHIDTHPLGDWDWYPITNMLNGSSKIPGLDPEGNPVIRDEIYLHTGLSSAGCVTVKSDVAMYLASDDGGIPQRNPYYPHSAQYDHLKGWIGASPVDYVDPQSCKPCRAVMDILP
jgi:RHS repeat-associated protein